ncbi:hypothetical protein AEAC466_09970 [Asticcacaulis sp. AC466]|uniref:cupin-like domain-containing protein n=1 Tax=Asticcacaulis sp. AC466 TaxID=1282362 RepID=UPI0003C3BB29|nr:cupin-like domain-containing protein [Asticcacaulis sp. AC466]ESQ84062.1 hypothetical protein AEAC466_09970 [Asticcacaulis sp. AC466]
MSLTRPEVRTVENIDRQTFESEVEPAGVPVILKGIAVDWPAVKAARVSPRALGDYLLQYDSGRMVDVAFAEKELKGRFFYNDRLTGVNYQTHKRALRALVGWCLSVADKGEVEAVYMQAQSVDHLVPDMAADLDMPLLDVSVRPRIWLGNTLRTQTHFDYMANIAVHIAGEKTFTLFAPDQTGNLYPGPLDMTPAGVPVSMASLEEPDFEHFPRLKEAIGKAVVARLEPGDGLFIPPLWWHHVQTIGPLNMLINYWWDPARDDSPDPVDALILAALAFKDMPPTQREAWRALLDYFVFETLGDPVAHLPGQISSPFRRNMSRQDMARFARIFGRRNE